MAIRVTKTFTRPSGSTPLYRDKVMVDNLDLFASYVKAVYVDTGLRTSFIREESPDGLTVRYITEWRDQAAYDQFLNDAQCKAMYDLRRAHNLANNITSGPPTVETL
jgi:quinol monooxygenase YgiN